MAGYYREVAKRIFAQEFRESNLTFKDCEIPEANLIGNEGQGLEIANATHEYARVSVAAIAIEAIIEPQ